MGTLFTGPDDDDAYGEETIAVAIERSSVRDLLYEKLGGVSVANENIVSARILYPRDGRTNRMKVQRLGMFLWYCSTKDVPFYCAEPHDSTGLGDATRIRRTGIGYPTDGISEPEGSLRPKETTDSTDYDAFRITEILKSFPAERDGYMNMFFVLYGKLDPLLKCRDAPAYLELVVDI